MAGAVITFIADTIFFAGLSATSISYAASLAIATAIVAIGANVALSAISKALMPDIPNQAGMVRSGLAGI
jgi:hypothetical protein